MKRVSFVINKNVLIAAGIGAVLGLIAGGKSGGNMGWSTLFGLAVGLVVGYLGHSNAAARQDKDDGSGG